MNRLGAMTLVVALMGAPAFANPFRDSIVAQLTTQGFSEISISRTLLGRTRVVAVSDKLRREIIFNPATGEILRDYWRNLPTVRTANRRDDNENSNPGRSTSRIVDPVVEDNENTKEDVVVGAPPATPATPGEIVGDDTADPAGDDGSTTDTTQSEETSVAPGEVGGSTSAGTDEPSDNGGESGGDETGGDSGGSSSETTND